MAEQNRSAEGRSQATSRWHLWLGSGIKRPRC